MKSLPWVTVLLAAALALPGHRAFGQRAPESTRAEMELPELPARPPLFGGLLEPGVELAAGIGGSKKQDLDLIQSLEEQVDVLDFCFRRVEFEYKTKTRSAHDFFRAGYELNAAKAELAWAKGDANGALRALEESLMQADLEIEAWAAREAHGLLVAPEGAQERRVAAARALARVQRSLGLQQEEAAGQQAADPSPDRGREPTRSPASEPAEALREHIRFLDESLKGVEQERTAGMASPASVAQTGYELNAAKAKLVWAQGDAKGTLDPRVAALKRRVEAVRALDRVKAALARQDAATPERTPDRLPELGAAGRQSAAAPGPEVVQARRQLVDFLEDYHKRVEADFRSGWCSSRDCARVGYELNAARAELAWAQADTNGALRALKEPLMQADLEIEAWGAREARGLAAPVDRRIAVVKRRGQAVKALARVKRHLARQQEEATGQQTPAPSKPLPR